MHAIIVRWRIKEGFVEAFEAEMKSHVAATRASEPGCLRFDVVRDKKEARTYHLFEIYRDDQAVADHRKSPTLAKLVEKAPLWVEDRSYFTGDTWIDLASA